MGRGGGGGIIASPNFVVSSSITIKFGVLIEFDRFSPKYQNWIFENNVNAELGRLYLLSQATVSFQISRFFISGQIWLKFVSGDKFKALIPNPKWYFTLEANIKPILAISFNSASRKAASTFDNSSAMETKS